MRAPSPTAAAAPAAVRATNIAVEDSRRPGSPAGEADSCSPGTARPRTAATAPADLRGTEIDGKGRIHLGASRSPIESLNFQGHRRPLPALLPVKVSTLRQPFLQPLLHHL